MSRPTSGLSGRFARIRRGRVAVFAVSILLVAGLVFTAFPFQTWLSQRHRTAAAVQKVNTLKAENQELEKTLSKLNTPAEIERLARAEFGMVRPGETAYAILPAAGGPLQLPDVWPATP